MTEFLSNIQCHNNSIDVNQYNYVSEYIKGIPSFPQIKKDSKTKSEIDYNLDQDFKDLNIGDSDHNSSGEEWS